MDRFKRIASILLFISVDRKTNYIWRSYSFFTFRNQNLVYIKPNYSSIGSPTNIRSNRLPNTLSKLGRVIGFTCIPIFMDQIGGDKRKAAKSVPKTLITLSQFDRNVQLPNCQMSLANGKVPMNKLTML